MRRASFALLATLILAATAPATAPAATPASGKVTTAAPRAEWTGSLQNPYLWHNVFNEEAAGGASGSFPCSAPGCDVFALDVDGAGADLLLEVASDQTEDMSLRIKDPGGAWTYYPGWGDAQKATKVRIKKAAKGAYEIDVVARIFGSSNPTAVTDTADYKASASLAIAPAPVAPPVAAPAPTPAPAQPAPAAAKPKSAKAACRKKAKKVKSARKRRAALKRCAKKR